MYKKKGTFVELARLTDYFLMDRLLTLVFELIEHLVHLEPLLME